MSDIRKRAVSIVARGLREGFMHPGDPGNDVPPTPVLIPLRSTPGQPQEMTDLLNRTVTLLSEAIVNELLTKGEMDLVERAEVQTMRRRLGDTASSPELIPMYCRCDVRRERPLAVLTVANGRVVVDGPVVLRALQAVTAQCPHTAVAS